MLKTTVDRRSLTRLSVQIDRAPDDLRRFRNVIYRTATSGHRYGVNQNENQMH